MTNSTMEFRSAVLSGLGASPEVRRELLAYNDNHFHQRTGNGWSYPLEDESFVPVWQQYAAEAEADQSVRPLELRLPQLQFPIEAGISKTAAYRAAVLRGALPTGGASTSLLESPERARVFVHATPAGRIPAIAAGTRGDFVRLVQALVHRNEPVPVPESMGACVVAGYNNLDRIARLRRTFLERNPAAGWPGEFERIRADKRLYQDSFLILSSGPYSAVSADAAGVQREEWIEKSLALRLEHESAHYFTRRVFASMQNRLIDEVIADFYAIVRVFGFFRAELMMLFFGLERFPAYRQGGRLENYRGTPPLSDAAFRTLTGLVHRAASSLERFCRAEIRQPIDVAGWATLMHALCGFTVEDLADSGGAGRLAASFRSLSARYSQSISSVADSGSERRPNSFEG